MQPESKADTESPQQLLVETGSVVEVHNEYVLVQTERSTGCGGCATKGCGTSVLAQLFSGTSKPIRVMHSQSSKSPSCQVGDKVELILDESRLLKHSFMAYGLPLIGLFIGALIFSAFFVDEASHSAWQDAMALLGAGLGLFVGWWVTRRFYQPVLPKIGRVFSMVEKTKA